jgi:hypothetical protein
LVSAGKPFTSKYALDPTYPITQPTTIPINQRLGPHLAVDPEKIGLSKQMQNTASKVRMYVGRMEKLREGVVIYRFESPTVSYCAV